MKQLMYVEKLTTINSKTYSLNKQYYVECVNIKIEEIAKVYIT